MRAKQSKHRIVIIEVYHDSKAMFQSFEQQPIHVL